MILYDGDVDQQRGQLQLLGVSIGEDDAPVAGAQAAQRVSGLPDEIGIPEHVLVLHQEPDQRQVWVVDHKLADVIPYWVYSVVGWK